MFPFELTFDGEYSIVQRVSFGEYFVTRQVICRGLYCSGIQGGDDARGGERQGGRRESCSQPQVGVNVIGLLYVYILID